MPSTTEQDQQSRTDNAAAHYDALYGRMSDLDGLFIPVWRKSEPTIWLDATDRDGFIRAVSTQKGGTVYTPVTPRAEKAGEFSHGTEKTVGIPQAIFVDFDVATPESGKSSADDTEDGTLGYVADHGEALRLLDEFAEETGLVPHTVVRTPGGYQVFWLTQPMLTIPDRGLRDRFEDRLAGFLALRGVKVDANVTSDPTRLCRPAGSLHSKESRKQRGTFTDLRPVTMEIVRDHAPYDLDTIRDACPPTSASVGRVPVPVDPSSPWYRYAVEVPVSSLLESEWGWTLVARRGSGDGEVSVYCANDPAAQSSENARVYADGDDPREHCKVFSETVVSNLRPFDASRRFDSFEMLKQIACGGDYLTAIRLVEAHSDDLAGLFAYAKTKTPEELAHEARRASGEWPSNLDVSLMSHLAVRGVDARVASERGYRSDPATKFADPDWPQRPASLTSAGDVLVAPVYDVGGKRSETARVPRHTIETDEGKVKVPASTMLHAEYNSRALDHNPMNTHLINDLNTPLIIVAGTWHDAAPDVAHGHAQIVTDAVLSAARAEKTEVAVIGISSWARQVDPAGSASNHTVEDRLGPQWNRVQLTNRRVYVAGRDTWRQEHAFAQFLNLLLGKGAHVSVIDTPARNRSRERSVRLDSSVPTVGDHLARARHRGDKAPLAALLASALPVEEARFQSAFVEDTQVGRAERMIEVLDRYRTHKYDVISKDWARDRGTHWQIGGPGVSPGPMLVRSLQASGLPVDSVRSARTETEYAREDERVQTVPDQFDTDPGLLYTGSGHVVSLRDDTVRERRQGEMNALHTPVAYDPNAKAPRWEQFVDEITCGDKEYAALLKRAAGMCAIGEILEELILIAFGGGRNGKTVFTNMLLAVLGAYARPVPVELFTGDATPSQLAQLKGVRFAAASESSEGAALKSAQVKKMSERSRIQAAQKYGREFDFDMSHTPLLSTNHKPRVWDQTEGIWRRLRLLPFKAQFTAESADPMLEAKLRAELPGILNWVVDGAREVYERAARLEQGERLKGGVLGTCALVEEASKQYRAENDIMARFVEQSATVGPGRLVLRSQFHDVLNHFLKTDEQLTKGWSAQTIANRLMERYPTVKVVRTATGRYYEGIDLTPPCAAPGSGTTTASGESDSGVPHVTVPDSPEGLDSVSDSDEDDLAEVTL